MFSSCPGCNCPIYVLRPVCGNDGVTYNNKCLAECNGVTELKCEKACDKCGDDTGNKGKTLTLGILLICNQTHNLTMKNIFLSSECQNCGLNNRGVSTCCGKGGSWKGLCGFEGEPGFKYTWTKGEEVCSETTPTPTPTITDGVSQSTTSTTTARVRKCPSYTITNIYIYIFMA